MLIDLTGDSDSEGAPAAKRPRLQPRAATKPEACDSDSDVELAEPPKAAEQFEAGDLGDDEDLVVTGDVGDVALRDYPHSRCDCITHRFSQTARPSNKETCAQCYCFICDCKVAECQFWGTGESVNHHCNAYSGVAVYNRLKSAFRAKDTASIQKAFQGIGPSAPSRFIPQPRNPAPPILARPAPQLTTLVPPVRLPGPQPPPQRQPAPPRQPSRDSAEVIRGILQARGLVPPPILLWPQPHPAPAPAKPAPAARRKRVPLPLPPPAQAPQAAAAAALVPMPDPAASSALIELGTLTYPCQATNGATIQQLAARLAPHGFYFQGHGTSYGDRLHLGNLLAPEEPRDSASHGRHLNLLPAGALPHEEPSPLRHRKILLVTYSDPPTPATYIGVTTNRATTGSQLRAAVEAVLRPPLASTEALVFALRERGSASTEWKLMEPEQQLNMTTDVAAFRVPAAPLARFRVGGSFRAEDAGYALVQHVWLYETEYDDDEYDSDNGCDCGACGGYDEYDSDDDEMYGMGYRGMGCLYGGCRRDRSKRCTSISHGRTRSWVSHPFLLPLDPADGLGGPEAVQKLTALLTAQLAPYRNAALAPPTVPGVKAPPGARAPAVPAFQLERMDAAGTTDLRVEARHLADYHAPGGPPRGTLWPPEGYCKDGVMRIRARWADMANPEDWDVAALETPPVDEGTLSPAAVQESAALDQQLRQHLQAISEARAAAGGTVSLLATCSNRHQTAQYARCSAAVTVSLECPDASAPSRGVLRLRVFAPKATAGAFNTPFATWNVGHMGNSALGSVVEALLKQKGDEVAAAMLEDMKAARLLHAKEGAAVNKLIESLVTGALPEAPQPEGLAVQMRGYQKQSLHFLLEAERREGGFRSLFWVPITNSQGQTYWFSPVWRKLALDVPAQPAGGFLAEEMGLGKTVEVLGLILANPAPASYVPGTLTPDGKIRSAGTLVVVAVSLVGQWVNEVKDKLTAPLRIYQYHGTRIRDKMKLSTNYDIVVTTYATLGADFKAGGASDPLSGIEWHRVVFDEGHTVKNVNVGHSKAAIALSGRNKWCCTGTPLSAAVEDLVGQCAAISLQPLATKATFDAVIKAGFSGRQDCEGAAILRYTLKKALVRHVKKQVLGGEQVLQLPAKTEFDVPVRLTAEERDLYLRTHSKVSEQWQNIRRWAPNLISQRILQIMSLLLPLRRICSGGTLGTDDLAIPDPLTPHSSKASASASPPGHPTPATPAKAPIAPTTECSVCLDTLDAPTRTPCGHWFCRECILGALAANPRCPMCRATAAPQQLVHGALSPNSAALAAAAAAGTPAGAGLKAGDEATTPGSPPQGDLVLCESKLRVLLQELRALREKDPTAKALIFSQYATTLAWLQLRLPQEGFGFRTITGSMAMKNRTKAIEAFQKDPPTTVFLLSVRSGAVGINLTAASHVFLLEPCINPALEEQAIGRAWRMGQTRPVTVRRLFVQGSVEERIMEVVKLRRAANYQAAIPVKHKKSASGTQIAGAIWGDKQILKVQELDTLFQAPTLPPPLAVLPLPAPPLASAGASGSGGQ